MNFGNVAAIVIPEGNVKKITGADGTVLWEKQEQTVDKYTWEAVLASIAAGTYATDYEVGDCVPLDLGDEGTVNMQIAGFDKDTKADGTGTAAISWISKELLATSHRMNPALSGSSGDYEAGTGTIGGWEQSEMRSYLNSTVGPMIPEPVASAIVNVKKTQPAYNTSGSSYTQTTEDWVWIPSYAECFGASSAYYGLFENTSANRIKYKVGASSALDWWLRSADSTSYFNYVHTDGSYSYYGAYYSSVVALGFCT